MFRKLLGGMVFGAGFAVAFIVVASLWLNWILPKQLGGMGHVVGAPPTATVTTAPPITNNHYLGSTGTYTSGFTSDTNVALAAGDGRIFGQVLEGDRPVAGLRLRLALNGSVWSQWATSDAEGRYEVPLPYGEYRLDGWELDKSTADQVLPGRIASPRTGGHPRERLKVGAGKPAEGYVLRFVAPIEKTGPEGEVSAKAKIVATWKPFPGASAYLIQLAEADGPDQFPARDIFSWNDRPRVTEPSFDLTNAGLRPGHYYFLNITAEDSAGQPISETARNYLYSDFKVTE
jgi:hypothetical protein